MKKLSIYLFLLGMLGAHLGFAQQSTTLRGKVLDETGVPIAGASLSLQGTQTATATDESGNFTIQYTSPAVLVVTALGFVGEDVNLSNQTTLTIRLLANEETLEEVVVVGYGTQRRGEVTSAISSVKAEDFTKGTVRDAAQLIQGKVAGMRITTPSGDPTGSTQINLRGLNSINGSQNPLVLIDGVPGDIATVAPEDIESVDVLKDGSAAAIYGTRATGGVLLITTRKNRSSESKTSIEYNGYANVQTIQRRPDMMDASDFRRLISEGYEYTDYGGNTNWLDQVLQTPVSHNHNLTFFGGNSRTNFTGSLNYRNWEGIMLTTGQERLNVRAALNHDMFDGKLRTNIQVINQTSKSNQGGTGGYIWRQAMIRNPTDNIYNEDGGWQERNDYAYDNPLGLIHESINDRIFRESRFSGSVDYRPIGDLSLKMLISRVINNDLTGNSTTFDHVNTTKNNLNGTASRSTGANTEDLLELTANYNKSFGDHRFTLLGGYSYQYNVGESFEVYNFDFPTDEYTYNRLESGTALQRGLATMESEKDMWKLAGFFGRVNYSWKDRYMLTASIRREGSSAFGANYQWGTFPGVSAAWNVANEEFMQPVAFVSEFKLRGGFGVTGTIANNPYQSQTSYNFNTSQGAYINGKWVPGFVPARNFNPDLRWEKKEEWNVGLDFGFMKNRVTGSLDYYVRNVKDLLYNFPVPTPPYLFGNMMLNAGEMQNSGFEVLVNVRAVETKTVKWNTNVTFSTNKNKLVNLSNEQFNVTREFFDAGHTGEPIQISTHRVAVGGPIGQYFVYKSVGLDENGGWLVESREGEVISMEDATPEDRQYYGNGIPKFNVGWNNTVNIQNFDVSVNFRGAFGHQVLNMQSLYYDNPVNRSYNVLKTAFDPIDGKELRNSLVYVSHYIEDADYLKIDNVTLGYTFKPNSIKGISNLRIYFSGLNLHTFTGYRGIDPEAVSYSGDFTFAPGMDHRDKYPSTRTYTLGLNVTF
ncbi:SusC/RagA family TonB-linked outer membrane protein [Parapedobacter pyrenivorans]|uniref:SusC/RagA family TonB-linked outer membrane protein n=1 Tax=Parapedobacter pyrenivorans TaxID=1305674 RepID=A0A917HE91_9SPHI|nr:SusC/RagA family TonB-linked outer membrane protein [Parapedobacter pyrenivorans]GGG76213.1 SusC/RagA family TonB-linked outer membrane protein [Parapedobacter pyrenivorans]